MKTFSLYTHYKKILADTITPVSIYLKIRDQFPNSILLESSDYHANDNSFSYICFNPIGSITVNNNKIIQKFPDGSRTTKKAELVVEAIDQFKNRFKVKSEKKFKFINNGLFGYTSYDAVKYFEDLSLSKKADSVDIPDLFYAVYQNIIVINHFKNEAYIFDHSFDSSNNIESILALIKSKPFSTFDFSTTTAIDSNLSDLDYKAQVELAKKHCARGDVYQLVLSKQFSQGFKGDEFNVYRSLRRYYIHC